MNLINGNRQIPVASCYGFPPVTIEAVKKEAGPESNLYALLSPDLNPKLSIGLSTDFICEVISYLDYFDAHKITKTIECENESNKLFRAIQQIAVASMRLIFGIAYDFYKVKKLEVSKILFGHSLKYMTDRKLLEFFKNDYPIEINSLDFFREVIPEDGSLESYFFNTRDYDFASPCFSRLKYMEIRKTDEPDERLICTLANSLSHLLSLEISSFADEELIILANGSCMVNLEELSILGAYITHRGMAALGRSKSIKNLNFLSLSTPLLSDQALALMACSSNYKRLKKLRLEFYYNNITEKGIKFLGDSPNFSSLEDLSISCASIDDAFVWSKENSEKGVVHILKSKYLTNLKTLRFDCFDLTDKSLKAFAESTSMRLESLSFYCCPLISDKGISYLADSPNLKSLKHLTISSKLITPKAIEILAYGKYTHLCQINLSSYPYSTNVDCDIDLSSSASIQDAQLESLQ